MSDEQYETLLWRVIYPIRMCQFSVWIAILIGPFMTIMILVFQRSLSKQDYIEKFNKVSYSRVIIDQNHNSIIVIKPNESSLRRRDSSSAA